MNARAIPPSAAEQSAAPGATVDGARRYRAFLSYSHADSAWARWLMRRLEGYRVPDRFLGRAAPIGTVGARLAPVFRDRDELPTTSDLGETIRTALRQSATLVVICSPASAKSRWVREEILTFKRLGGGARVFAFIVDGEPKAEGTDEDCFSPALRRELGADGLLSATAAEVVAADARPQGDGREDALVRLVAGLLGVGFDELRQREQARRLRRLTWIAGGSAAGMAIMAGLAVFAVRARDDAQRRQEKSEAMMAQMLEDFEARLRKSDQLESLDETSRNVMAYFQSLDPRDLTDKSNMQQAKLLTQIGRMRIAQLRYAEAITSFTAAFQRSTALVDRHPGDGDMLFERAQAEYWIGFVHYKHRELALAGDWFARYRDSGVALARLEPEGQRGHQEEISGYHNLAVLELERGDLAGARRAFAEELAVREKLAAAKPKDTQLQFNVANIVSFLGTVAERDGDLAEAARKFGEQAQRLDGIVAAEPNNAHWRRRLADAIGLQTTIMAVSGQRAESFARRGRMRELLEALVAQDPLNREWQSARLSAQVRDAWLLVAAGDKAAAEALVRECRPALEKLAADKAADRVTKQNLALAWRVEAQAAADLAAAAAAATQATSLGKSLLDPKQGDEPVLGEYATACVVAGTLARLRGDAAGARDCWLAALDAALPLASGSNFWRVLDPAARALGLLGRVEEGRALVKRLHQLGYRPLDPWPEEIASSSPSGNLNRQ